MTISTALDVKCEDFLKGNQHLYAHKAKRKKIALVRVDAAVNSQSEEVKIDLGAAKLIAAGKSYSVEAPNRIIRRFCEFTWDFLLYLIVDFQPLLAVADVAILLSGPLYNRRLKKQLRLLTDGDMVLRSGQSQSAILGFRGVPAGTAQLNLMYRCGDDEPQRIECAVN